METNLFTSTTGAVFLSSAPNESWDAIAPVALVRRLSKRFPSF